MAKFDLTGSGPSKVWNPITRRFEPYFDGTDALGDYNKEQRLEPVEYYPTPVPQEENTYKNPKSVEMDQGYNRHSSGAMREKIKSIRYDYMPARIVNEAYARVADFGAKKYDVDNWMKGLPQSQLSSSLQRHLWAYMDGEDTDVESGLSHIDHVLWNAVALAYHRYHDLEDDRFESRKVSK